MALNANVIITPPALPDADVWFANAQDWLNYWMNVPATTDISIATSIYAEDAYNANLQPAVINIDGTDYVLATKAMFDDLVAMVTALNTSYKNFRIELKASGLITEA